MNESFEAQNELKIRKIKNGWLLKSPMGWTAFTEIDDLLNGIRVFLSPVKGGEVEAKDPPERFFNKEWPYGGARGKQ